MIVCFSPVNCPPVDRLSSLPGHRVKAKSTTLGATRSGLIQVLRHLGLYREKIAARFREEREIARALELERLIQLPEEREAARRDEESRQTRLHEQEHPARLAEGRNAARLLREKMEYESMSEEQKAAWRLEEEIVSWITSSGR